MSKQVLIEYNIFKPLPQQLQEARYNPSKNLIVSGKMQEANRANANKRIYSKPILEREINKYVEGPIAENRALGELDHPESSIINLKNVSHNITKVWWDGDDLYGQFEILPTPSGNILKELFLNNINVGVSSRALGSVSPLGEGLVQVEEDLEIICWDFVSTPSTYGAYVKPIGLNEGYSAEEAIKLNKYTKVNELISQIICEQSGVCCIR
jgi:hypothetical protein